jgi:hypothetical protein
MGARVLLTGGLLVVAISGCGTTGTSAGPPAVHREAGAYTSAAQEREARLAARQERVEREQERERGEETLREAEHPTHPQPAHPETETQRRERDLGLGL